MRAAARLSDAIAFRSTRTPERDLDPVPDCDSSQRRSVCRDAGTLNAVSYNIHSSIGRDRVCDPARILDVLAGIDDAAIVGLQEVDARRRPRQQYDQFEYFCANSGMQCIAGPNVREHRGHYGNALLTRLPVEHTRLIELSVRGAEPRGAILVVLRCGRHRLQVLNTHLGLRAGERRAQARILASAVAAHDGPTLFMGDFNVWHPRSAALGLLDAPTTREYAPRTFPARRPVLALDRIWGRPLGMVRNVGAVRNELTAIASDHLPVVASVVLPE